jgi:hypothetical protein
MTESIGLQVELEGSEIIVTMPGTIFMVTYRKREGAPELIANFVQTDELASTSRAEFLARSWRLANDKARELGWIV